MSQRIQQLKTEWEDRGHRLGLTQRAVLFKRFPHWLNDLIHRQHVRFVLQHIPAGATQSLDVGCGYGRISQAIKHVYPQILCCGIDLCDTFASAYQREIGPCFCGAIQDFQSEVLYDAIIVITLLMYLEADEQEDQLKRLWDLLRPGGRLICIEPAVEVMRLWQLITRQESASPTGGEICYFSRPELCAKFQHLEGASIADHRAIRMMPFFPAMTLHHGLMVQKA